MTDEPPCPVVRATNLSSVICYLSFRRAESEAMNPPMSQAFTCDRAPGRSVYRAIPTVFCLRPGLKYGKNGSLVVTDP
jgi:hypothetical protein